MSAFFFPPRVRPLRTLALALALSACGERAPDPSTPIEWWVLEGPTVRIGTLEEGPAALSRVGDLAVAPEGELYVLLPQEREIRVFEPDGTFLRRIGREGEGPGEMTGPRSLALFGDTILVPDDRLLRITAYDLTGAPILDRPLPVADPGDPGLAVRFAAPLAGGRTLHSAGPQPMSDLFGTDRPFPLLILSADGSRLDTAAVQDLENVAALFTTSSGGRLTSISILRQPLSDATLWEVAPDGRTIVVVDRRVPGVGERPAYRVTRVSLQGDTLFSVAVPYEPVPLPSSVTDTLLGGLEGPNADDLRERVFLPETLTPVSALVPGADGTVWVAREKTGGPTRTWDVLDAEGEPMARLDAPAGLVVHHATADEVWGVVTDELDVPYVVRYLVVRRQSSSIR